MDIPLSNSGLVFEDGSKFATGTIAGCPYESGYVMHKTSKSQTHRRRADNSLAIGARVIGSFAFGGCQ